MIPKPLLDYAVAQLPPAVQQIYQAQQQLRQTLTTVNATYEQIENLAVLTGIAPTKYKIRDIPRGRWSYHPGGYFVRYFPSGYQRTRFEVYRPAPFKVMRDEWGRIVALDGGGIIRVETSYLSEGSRSGHMADGLLAHQLREVRIAVGTSSNGQQQAMLRKTIKTRSWTLIETANNNSDGSTASKRLAKQRKVALERRNFLAALRNLDGRQPEREALKEILDVSTYADTIRAALGASKSEPWISDILPLLDHAVHSTLAARLRSNDTGEQDLIAFDPTDHVLVPANTYGQRLISSGEPVRQEERFSHKVDEAEGICPESIRQKYGNKNNHWFQSSSKDRGHWYLALNSLGRPDLSLIQAINLLKNDPGAVFPGRAIGVGGKAIKESRYFLLQIPFGFPVQVIYDGKFFWTFETRYWHPLSGTAAHGICQDETGELWMFQEGVGVPGEWGWKQRLNYFKAREMWEDMADNMKKLMARTQSR